MSVNNTIYMLQSYGIFDFLLPFVLVFTIIFAIMNRVELFKGPDKKKFRVIIALVMGLVFVIPHYTGNYPFGINPVEVINQSIPSIGLLAVAIVMVLMLIGVFEKDLGNERNISNYLAILSIIFVGYIFGSSLNFWRGPYDMFYWWTPQLTELLIILAVFGIIVWFITSKPSNEKVSAKVALKKIDDGVSWIFRKKGVETKPK